MKSAAEEGKPVNRVYPKDAFDLFAGEQLVVVGRYKKAGAAKVVVSGTVGGRAAEVRLPRHLHRKEPRTTRTPSSRSSGPSAAWAKSSTSWTCKGKNDELVKELVELSKRHGILTPYTSFMADENTNLNDVASQTCRRGRPAAILTQTSGAGGVGQRAFKGEMKTPAAQAGRPRPRSAVADGEIRRARAMGRLAVTASGPAAGGGRAASGASRPGTPRPPSKASATSATAPSSAAAANGSTPA